jgi:phenol 2-monooxygenase
MDEEGISMEEFKEAFSKGNRFASGVGKLSINNSMTE